MADVRRRRSWTRSERRAVLERAQAMRASGQRWAEIAREMDVWPSSLQRWVEALAAPSLVPVVVEQE